MATCGGSWGGESGGVRWELRQRHVKRAAVWARRGCDDNGACWEQGPGVVALAPRGGGGQGGSSGDYSARRDQ